MARFSCLLSNVEISCQVVFLLKAIPPFLQETSCHFWRKYRRCWNSWPDFCSIWYSSLALVRRQYLYTSFENVRPLNGLAHFNNNKKKKRTASLTKFFSRVYRLIIWSSLGYSIGLVHSTEYFLRDSFSKNRSGLVTYPNYLLKKV